MSAKKRNALGRGLGALLEDSDKVDSKSAKQEKSISSENFIEVEHHQVETNPFQPRNHFDQEALEELAESIRVQGIIQPITIRRVSEGAYQLISGERRFQASKLAGLKKVPAYVRTANDQQMLEMGLIENIQRENLNAIEIALSYQRLISECDLKQEELGDRVGKKRATINNYLRLLKLPPDIQAAVRDQKLSMGHARTLISIEDIDMQLSLFKKIMAEDLSVRKTELLVRDLVNGTDKPSSEPTETVSHSSTPEIQRLQTKLSSHFGTKINVKSDQKHKGEIKIPFVSLEDLNRILEILEI